MPEESVVLSLSKKSEERMTEFDKKRKILMIY